MNVREYDTQKHGGPLASVPKQSLLKSFRNAFRAEEISCININDHHRGEKMKQHLLPDDMDEVDFKSRV